MLGLAPGTLAEVLNAGSEEDTPGRCFRCQARAHCPAHLTANIKAPAFEEKKLLLS